MIDWLEPSLALNCDTHWNDFVFFFLRVNFNHFFIKFNQYLENVGLRAVDVTQKPELWEHSIFLYELPKCSNVDHLPPHIVLTEPEGSRYDSLLTEDFAHVFAEFSQLDAVFISNDNELHLTHLIEYDSGIPTLSWLGCCDRRAAGGYPTFDVHRDSTLQREAPNEMNRHLSSALSGDDRSNDERSCSYVPDEATSSNLPSYVEFRDEETGEFVTCTTEEYLQLTMAHDIDLSDPLNYYAFIEKRLAIKSFYFSPSFDHLEVSRVFRIEE